MAGAGFGATRYFMGNRDTASHPDWLARTSFFVRSKGLQVQRSAANAWHRAPVLRAGAAADFPHVLSESVVPLYTGGDPRERPLVLGKIQNLRVACSRIHHRVLHAGVVFSLWRQVGPPWRSRGFVRGREVREGCVIPTFGGGLCQLSGSLLEAARALDLELLEHHRHTLQPAGVPRDSLRDATLFWNYVDLRFRSSIPLLVESYLTDISLVVRFRGKQPRQASVQVAGVRSQELRRPEHLKSCFTCGKTECALHKPATVMPAKTAFVMDACQPEFTELLRNQIRDTDQLLVPFLARNDFSSFSEGGRYAVESPRCFGLLRSLTLRWTVFRGATVAQAHFELAGVMARFAAQRIGYDVEHLCVAQSLLPHLWRSGVLGGRTFDVFAERLPVAELERQLDAAAQLYPQSGTLAEFRAPRWFAQAEQEALKAARTVFTPHSQLAAVFDRSVRLRWQAAPPGNGHHGPRDMLVFLGPTLARKGAYAVREAVKKTGLTLAVAGAELEGPDFWHGMRVVRVDPQELRWERVHTVVQPALIEYWPRQLLCAHAARANLVISPMCGLEEDHGAGIYHVPFGEADALAATLTRLFSAQGALPCES
jgi:hypothetical protein